jgi:hypothetical protein
MMKATSLLCILALSLAAAPASAKTIYMRSPEQREEVLQNAQVWSAPKWLSKDFKFDSAAINVATGPELKGNDKRLLDNDVYCQVTTEDLEKPSGKTPKFYCRLLSLDPRTGAFEFVKTKKGELYKVKVKYGSDKTLGIQEVQTEVFGTRLLWALGFGADHAFRMKRVHCYGCTENPFKDRKIDQSTLRTPRVFDMVAGEIKLDGDEMKYDAPMSPGGPREQPRSQPPKEGFWLPELMKNRSKDKTLAKEQRIQRDALRLLMVMLQNVDLKPPNMRITCVGDEQRPGLCKGTPVAYVQDIGAILGGGSKGLISVDKANLKKWGPKLLWSNPERCKANMGKSIDFSMWSPQITDEARVFLSNLLQGFSEGPEGRKRVETLFLVSGMAPELGPLDQWINAFYWKVEQMRFPMGRDARDFECSKTLD